MTRIGRDGKSSAKAVVTPTFAVANARPITTVSIHALDVTRSSRRNSFGPAVKPVSKIRCNRATVLKCQTIGRIWHRADSEFLSVVDVQSLGQLQAWRSIAAFRSAVPR